VKRASGILLHISSLPSNLYIGTLADNIDMWIDYLVFAKQKYWQILPIHPVDIVDSPYASGSAYAGNIYLISITKMLEDEFIENEDIADIKYADGYTTDYFKARQVKNPIFKIASRRFFAKTQPQAFKDFVKKHKAWLDDYVLFAAIHDQYDKGWYDWDDKLKFRDPVALKAFAETHKDEINFHYFTQYIFFKQFDELKKKLAKAKIKLIGDIPMYVSYDSADVWCNRSLFMLDEKGNQTDVAGVPPDGFSKDGQLWGNPLYNYQEMRKDNYSFWQKRIQHCALLYDALRIDHFRAFDTFYAIKAGAKNARKGVWHKGEGIKLLNVLKAAAPNLEFIAEDLGSEMENVEALRKESGMPGMKVMQFGIDGDNKNPMAPHNYEKDYVAYLGTHDNDTIMIWWNNITPKHKDIVYNYCGFESEKEINRKLMKVMARSVAYLVVYQMQDVVGNSFDLRMNLPGTVINNWKYMAKPEDFKKADALYLASLSDLYGR
jgi:4-alpha-glucanotransferase